MMRSNLVHNLVKIKAFTLLELLVALAIFAVIAVVAYTGLNTVLNVRTQTQSQVEQLAEIQMAALWLRRDMEQCIARSVRDEYGGKLPILQASSSYIEFTRAGWSNPLQRSRSSLQRVAYYLENNRLWRAHWQVLDRAQDSKPQVAAILSQVEELDFRFLDSELQWHDQWKEAEMGLQAIEVNLAITTLGKIRWLFQCSLPKQEEKEE